MKPILLTYFAFFFALACAHAQSARQDNPETSLLNRHKELSSRTLSEAQLQAYTKRAKQKLADVVDYMQIAVSEKYTETQQKQALKQLQALFWETPTWAKSLPALQQYVGKDASIALQQTSIEQPLAYHDAITYKGMLSYTLATKSTEIATKNSKINFIVHKNKKIVGSQEVIVWEVFL